MTASFSDVLRSAQLEALNTLLEIMRDAHSQTQARLAAAAILRFRPAVAGPEQPSTPSDSLEPAPEPPLAAPCHPDPLSSDELAQLRRLVPHFGPATFLTDDPERWRAFLKRCADSAASASRPQRLESTAAPPPERLVA